MKAFPTGKTGNKNYDFYVSQDGMDLRDYFAAKAMQAGLSLCSKNWDMKEVRAKEFYEMADAMIKVREIK